jgi:hypothetical protein
MPAGRERRVSQHPSHAVGGFGGRSKQMSRKWQRAKRWDDVHLSSAALRPVKWTLRSLSSIWLAVILLTLVALYGVLASVPIGMLALAPTWAFYGVTVVVPAGAIGIGASVAVRAVIPARRRALRLSGALCAGIAGFVAVSWVWGVYAWPALQFDPADGSGVRFFHGFVTSYAAVTLRRLPGLEMTELEFYSWWPLRIILLVFVVNMIVATVRRIEFTFKNLGVLTVHTGIVIISLGSIYYQGLKKEGDTIIFAGSPEASGVPGPGPTQTGFYDNTAVALWVAQRRAWTGRPDWEQRPLRGLPRYNDYALSLGGEPDARRVSDVLSGEAPEPRSDERSLSVRVPLGSGQRIDPDIGFRIVGYASYASPREDWVRSSVPPTGDARPLRVVEVLSRLDDAAEAAGGVPVLRSPLHPTEPSHRVAENDVFVIEHQVGADAQRVGDLLTPVPPGTAHTLIVEVPAETGDQVARVILAAEPGNEYVIGETGWRVGVRQLLPEPPFPIITDGYDGATSPTAVLRVTPPEGDAYDRYVYDRFPELNQDIFDTPQPDGRPNRRDADPAIRIAYLELTRLRVLLDEDPESGKARAIIREPGGGLTVKEPAGNGEIIRDIVPKIDLRVSEAWEHIERVEQPVPVPAMERENRFVGTHDMAMAAVELSVPTSETETWTHVVWLPYSRYLETSEDLVRTVTVPGGREITLAFGRVRHPFPGFGVRLLDFEMIAYDHRGAPRDYQSLLRVVPQPDSAGRSPLPEAYDRVAKLNAPLRAPFVWEEERSWPANAAVRLTSGLNPNQYKLSQAGWDQQGWEQTQTLADAGTVPRPFARFTILQVGNNPGIHVIAFGGILMGIGTPWAFYVKPWLVRREKARLAAEHAMRAAPAGVPGNVVQQEAVQA